jgi:predicted nucleic acid-binding Zn ribbon protein
MLVSFAEAANGNLECDDCGGKLKRVFSVTADSRGASSTASQQSNSSCGFQGG